jgi:hypothetical protein
MVVEVKNQGTNREAVGEQFCDMLATASFISWRFKPGQCVIDADDDLRLLCHSGYLDDIEGGQD